jgi:hypothetical protein
MPASGSLRMTPGRLLTLAIGVPVILALIGWIGFGAVAQVAQASFPVSYRIPVQDGQLVASVGSGDITVRQGQGTAALLTGRVQYDLVRPTVTERNTASGAQMNVNCRVPTGNCGLDATLEVPPQTAVSLSSGGGDLSVSGVDDNVTLSSEGGDVAVSGIGGIATVDTGGGDLTAGDLAGILKFSTSGGDINGNGLSASTLSIGSGGGDVTLVFTKPPANLTITSDGGDVTVLLPHGGTTYRIASSADGGDDSESVPVSPSSPNLINVDSGGGDISIAEPS